MKQTGGAGFRYEDLVGAYLAASMLAGEDPTANLQVAGRIDFQVAQAHWRLDDLLYTLEDGVRMPSSIKSAQQFPQGRAPTDFVRDAWSEILGLSGTPFDPARDLVGLIAPRPGTDTERDLGDLITWSATMDVEDVEQRLQAPGAASDGHRALWKSFECPEELRERSGENPPTSSLLARLRFCGLDLLLPNSGALPQALGWCKRALVDPAQAPELWDRLLSIVAERRPAGGMIDWPTLREELPECDLRGAIDYEADRRVLAEIAGRNLKRIQAEIAGKVTIVRSADIAKVSAAQAAGAPIALVGPSGCGKTVVAKQWTETHGEEDVIWLRPHDLQQIAEGSSPLAHDLEDVLDTAPRPLTFVIDGLDRRFDEAPFLTAARLIELAGSDEETSLIFTSQEQEWARVAERLRLANGVAPWEIVSISSFSSDEVGEVLSQLPPLRELAAKSHLAGVLSRPKVLDAIASRLYEGHETQQGEIGGDEATVARWFWEHGLGTGADRQSRAAFLLDLGERLADDFEATAPLQELDPIPVEHLRRDGICDVDANRVSFSHDLYGDWARYQALLAHEPKLADYLRERIDSPIWHRSVRLYALGQLTDGGAAAWREQMEELGAALQGHLPDLFLDSPVFAADAAKAIESIWSTLTSGEGGLLSRFLSRFRHTASVPNPFLMAAFQAAEPDVAIYAAANNRVPLAPLWLPLLEVLSRHREEALAVADVEVAQVVDLWLRTTPPGTPCRNECAELALAAARLILDQSARPHTYVAKEIQAHHLRAALASIWEQPQEVEQLVRFFIDPIDDAERPNRSAESIAAEETIDFDPFEDDDDSYIWLGAGTREGFRDLCLDTDALDPMIAASPDLAAEVLTKLVVPPQPDRPRRAGSLTHGFGVYGDFLWSSPLWIRGPFFKFLNVDPEVGTRLVVDLANAATDRYIQGRDAEFLEERAEPITELPLLGGWATWKGDGQVFVWYTGDSRCPKTISSALMALEKWLYDQIDRGEDVDATIEQILAESRSVALAGLLLAIGYYRPELFKGPLRPLLGASTLYHWEHARLVQGNFQHQIGLFLEPDLFREMITQWHGMPHRCTVLESVTQTLFLTDAGTEEFVQAVRARWRERNEEQDRHLAARLDRANWSLEEADDGTQRWEYTHPAELLKETEQFNEEAGERIFWLEMSGRMRRAIDDRGKDEPDDAELEQFWEQTAARAEGPYPDDLDEGGVFDPLDVRCGIAAFLTIRHRDWVIRNPETDKWCRQTLLAGALTKPKATWFDSDQTLTDWGYESFCAEALPRLWAEAPDDPEIRAAIAILAVNRHYDVIARLYRSASDRRGDLGSSFCELQSLAVHVARFRTRRKILTQLQDEAGAKENLKNLEVALSAFESGQLEREPGDFSVDAAAPLTSGSRSTGRRRQSRTLQPTIDLHHIWAAWLWMPPFSDATDPAEHASWLLFWERMIAAVLQRSETGDEDEGYEADRPRYEYENAMLASMPSRILELEDAGEAEDLWRPLLALGPASHSWIDSFLTSWIRTGLAQEDSEKFAERWEAMLRFASANWQERSYDGASNWLALLAMGPWLNEADWGERNAALFDRLRPFYESWAADGLKAPRAASAFARLLRRPSCEPLVDDGLVWLQQSEPITAGDSWDEVGEDLISTLSTLATRRPDLPRAATRGGKAFRALLGRAVERHDRVGLALQERLFGGAGGPTRGG